MGKGKYSGISIDKKIIERLEVNKYLCNARTWDLYFKLNMAVLDDFAIKFSKYFNQIASGERETFPTLSQIKIEGVEEIELPSDIKKTIEKIMKYSQYAATE